MPTRLDFIHTHNTRSMNKSSDDYWNTSHEKRITDIDVGLDGFLYFLVSQDDGTTLKNTLKIN